MYPPWYPYVQGPVPIQGLASPAQVHYNYAATNKINVPTPPPKEPEKKEDVPPQEEAKKPDDTKSKSSTSHKSSWTTKTSSSSKTAVSSPKPAQAPPPTIVPAPPKKRPQTTPTPHVRSGTNYMFPTEHTVIHVLQKAAKVWEDKHTGKKFQFNIYNVGTNLTVKDVIHNVMRNKVKGDWEKCAGWACTEVIEMGDGKWGKGTTVEYGSDKAAGTLGSMGWNARRGESLPPVWVTVHKV